MSKYLRWGLAALFVAPLACGATSLGCRRPADQQILRTAADPAGIDTATRGDRGEMPGLTPPIRSIFDEDEGRSGFAALSGLPLLPALVGTAGPSAVSTPYPVTLQARRLDWTLLGIAGVESGRSKYRLTRRRTGGLQALNLRRADQRRSRQQHHFAD